MARNEPSGDVPLARHPDPNPVCAHRDADSPLGETGEETCLPPARAARAPRGSTGPEPDVPSSGSPHNLALDSARPTAPPPPPPHPPLGHDRETLRLCRVPAPLLDSLYMPRLRTKPTTYPQLLFAPITHLSANRMHVSSRAAYRRIRILQRLCIWLRMPLHCSRQLVQNIEVGSIFDSKRERGVL